MNKIKSLLVVFSLMLLQACETIPESMKYVEPELPEGSASITGSMVKSKGILNPHEYMSVQSIDGRMVAGRSGPPWSKSIAMLPGDRYIEVNYWVPEKTYSSALIQFEAKAFVKYQAKFEQPYVPSEAELEEYRSGYGAVLDPPLSWARTWVENTETGEKSNYVLMPVLGVTVLDVPIFL